MKTINELGDTIVEVLIAVAVMSMVLGGAYSIASRSLSSIRQAQEHTVALKYAEAQIEQLKQMATNKGNDYATTPNNIFSYGSNFCSIYATVPTPGLYIYPDSNANCTKSNGIPYHISISRTDSGHVHKFTTLVHWDNIRGDGQDNVTLTYNLDQ